MTLVPAMLLSWQFQQSPYSYGLKLAYHQQKVDSLCKGFPYRLLLGKALQKNLPLAICVGLAARDRLSQALSKDTAPKTLHFLLWEAGIHRAVPLLDSLFRTARLDAMGLDFCLKPLTIDSLFTATQSKDGRLSSLSGYLTVPPILVPPSVRQPYDSVR